MKFSRKTFLKSLGGLSVSGILGVTYMKYFEPDWLEVTEKNVRINRFDTPLRILHLSDFHASRSVSLRSIEKAVDLALKQDADVAFITGDFITTTLSEAKEYQRILKKLTNVIPTYACTGNHDGGRWAATSFGYKDFSKVAELLKSSNVTLLFNNKAAVTIRDKTFVVVGLGDLWSKDLKPQEVLTPQREIDLPVFVLSHNPDSKTELKEFDWDMIFCGHTHGGQCIVPIIGFRPFLPVRDKSFPEGLLTWGNRHIHITRGVGNLHGLRFNCRPEISILNVT